MYCVIQKKPSQQIWDWYLLRLHQDVIFPLVDLLGSSLLSSIDSRSEFNAGSYQHEIPSMAELDPGRENHEQDMQEWIVWGGGGFGRHGGEVLGRRRRWRARARRGTSCLADDGEGERVNGSSGVGRKARWKETWLIFLF
jgi:hypothetical protein